MTTDRPTDFLDKLADAALTCAADTPWGRVSLSDVCAASGQTLADCARYHVTKAHVVAHLDVRIDQAMLSEHLNPDRSQSVRDRLFEILMSRFDTMEAAKVAWVSILKAERSDGAARLARQARRVRAGAWALEAAGVTASNVKGMGRAIGLGRVLRLVEAVWVEDGPDLAKTMARLDQELRQGEDLLGQLETFKNFLSPKRASAHSPASPPEASDPA
jgi:ubiquinone biosynthesis protein COQ9